MKKIMILCSLLLILLEIFAIDKGLRFELFPKASYIITCLVISSSTFIFYSFHKKRGYIRIF